MEIAELREQHLYQEQNQDSLQPPQIRRDQEEVHPEHLNIKGELEHFYPGALKIKEEYMEFYEEPLDIKVVQVELDEEPLDTEDGWGVLHQEPFAIKKAQEELCSRLDGQQFVVKQETETFSIKSECEEMCLGDEIKHQLDNTWSPETGLHGKARVTPPTAQANVATASDAPHHHAFKTEIHSDQQLFNQEKNASLDPEEPHLPQVKEEEDEDGRGSSGEREQALLNRETNGLMVTEEWGETVNFFIVKYGLHDLYQARSLKKAQSVLADQSRALWGEFEVLPSWSQIWCPSMQDKQV
ncbi:uncharacterized protein KZ484_021875 [Pholidichthys leucotaenia]